MATRFNGTSAWWSRTTNLPSITSLTMMVWMYSLGTESFPAAFSIGPSGSGVCYLPSRDATNVLQIWTGATTATGSAAMAINTWHHVALTCAGTGANQLLGYLNGTLDITTTGDAGVTNAVALLAQSNDSANPNSCRLTGVKFYNAVLTQNEIRNEMRSLMPIRTQDLTLWSPMLTHLDRSDYVGGVDWTLTGTATTEQGPPVPWSLRAREAHVSVAPAPPTGKLLPAMMQHAA